MLNLALNLSADEQPCILFLGAHSDDIEIGCGATVLRLANELPGARIHWVVFSANDDRSKEVNVSADDFLTKFTDKSIEIHGIRDAYFPEFFGQLKDIFEALKTHLSPDIIFTHHKDDLHQDHRVIGDLTWNTFRNHFILEYEVPKYDGGLGDPNFFMYVSDDLRKQKLDKLHRHFETQKDKAWFTGDLFSALMRLRGAEGASPTGFAEAFYCRKAAFSLRSINDRM